MVVLLAAEVGGGVVVADEFAEHCVFCENKKTIPVL